MSDANQFTGVLTDADDGAIVLLEQSPNDGLLIAKGKNKITLWPDQLKELIKVFQAWQDGR